MSSYQEHYDILEELTKDPRIVESPTLYNFDSEAMFAAMMDMLAQPLPSGEESPFSARAVGGAHARLLSAFIYLHQLLGTQINLIPDLVWVQFFRSLGLYRIQAEYPIVELTFTRDYQSVLLNYPVTIPIGTEVQSKTSPGMIARTREEITFSGQTTSITVLATLNQLGSYGENIPDGDLSVLMRPLPFILSVSNAGLASEGRNKETLPELMLRAREAMRRGERAVTARDYLTFALDPAYVGAKKAIVIPGVLYNSPGYFGNALTIALYPESVVNRGIQIFQELKSVTAIVDVVPAEVVKITGSLTVKATPGLQEFQIKERVARAIAEKINPPNGTWGDENFLNSLYTAIEGEAGIFAVTQSLIYANGEPLPFFKPNLWQLFSVDNLDVKIEFV